MTIEAWLTICYNFNNFANDANLTARVVLAFWMKRCTRSAARRQGLRDTL